MSVLSRVAEWPADTVAVGVATAHGPIDTFGPTDRVLPWASVTKPVVALATLVELERGTLGLEDPAGPEGATVRHLLAHTSGLPFEEGQPGAAVGQRRVYSNLGFVALGEAVAKAVGAPIDIVVEANVLDPLGMADTRLVGHAGAGMEGTVEDLLAFAVELLEPTLVSADLFAEATRPHWPDLAGVLPGFGKQDPNPWGLGFEIRGHKSPHWTGATFSPATFGHFGGSGSFLWVDPEVGLAGVELCDRPFGEWAAEVWPGFNDAVRETYA